MEKAGGMRRAAKVDSNQPEIVAALRALGISVEIIGKPLDLLIYNPRRNETALLEVKNPDGKNELTKEQVQFLERWPGPVYIARSKDEAIRLIIGEEAMA